MSHSIFGAIFFPLRDFLENTEFLDGILRNSFKSLKTNSKRFQMVPTYPSMSLRTFVNVVKVILQNLETTEFVTEFRIICSLIPLTLSTPQFGYQSAVALFCVNLRNIGATFTLNDTIWKTLNLPHNVPRNFFKSLETDSKLLQMVKIYPSMSWRIFGNVIKLVGHNLENTEFLTEFLGTCSKCLQPIPNS